MLDQPQDRQPRKSFRRESVAFSGKVPSFDASLDTAVGRGMTATLSPESRADAGDPGALSGASFEHGPTIALAVLLSCIAVAAVAAFATAISLRKRPGRFQRRPWAMGTLNCCSIQMTTHDRGAYTRFNSEVRPNQSVHSVQCLDFAVLLRSVKHTSA